MTDGKVRRAYNSLMTRLFGRHKCKWPDNIVIGIEDMECVDGIGFMWLRLYSVSWSGK
jgi:hypothetical protein